VKKHKIKIDVEALHDIQEATDWYIMQSDNLGNRFQKQVKLQIDNLEKNAFTFGIRYANVRCMLIKKFPFLVHFTIDEVNNTVNIFALLHTSRIPEIWKTRRKD